MSKKSRNVLWIVAGMYLSYTGYSLFRNVLATDTDKKVMFMIFAVAFMGAGLFLVGYAIYNMYKNLNSEDTVEVDEEEAQEGAKEAQEAIEKLEEQEKDEVEAAEVVDTEAAGVVNKEPDEN